MIGVAQAFSVAARSVWSAGVAHLLVEVDQEFFPPLSARTDTLSMNPYSGSAAPGLGAYLDAMRLESWLVAHDEDVVVGLISFIDGHDPALAPWSPSLYATTVAVTARGRRAGVTTTLYDELENVARTRGVPFLTTRTWTTNTDHLQLLQHRGFQAVIELPDDRAPGIGTIYLARQISN